MSQINFFDIPVYRLSKEKYYDDREKYIRQKMFDKGSNQIKQRKEFYKRNPEQKEFFENHLENKFGGAWNYNEIIGWIKLHFLGNQIRGEYWVVEAKRIVKTRKKQFIYETWKLAPEIDIPVHASNEKILSLIYEYIKDCQHELKNRYFDISNFDQISKYIDWRSVINENRKFV